MTARERVNRGRELPGPERPPDVTAYRAAMDTQARRELRAWQVQASIARIWQALASWTRAGAFTGNPPGRFAPGWTGPAKPP